MSYRIWYGCNRKVLVAGIAFKREVSPVLLTTLCYAFYRCEHESGNKVNLSSILLCIVHKTQNPREFLPARILFLRVCFIFYAMCSSG